MGKTLDKHLPKTKICSRIVRSFGEVLPLSGSSLVCLTLKLASNLVLRRIKEPDKIPTAELALINELEADGT
jgi:hypothetical protein